MRRSILPLVALVCFGGSSAWAAEAPSLDIWAVDPLVKVFPDATPTVTPTATQTHPADTAITDVARGEHASLQAIVRCPVMVKSLKVSVTAFALEGGDADKILTPRPPRFVGYVPVNVGTPKPSTDRLRVPPAFFPDPLLEKDESKLSAGTARPIWITIPVPIDTTPGLYRGKIQVSGTADGKAISAELPLAVQVWPIKVGKCRLWVTNWFQINSFSKCSQDGRFEGKGEIKPYSDTYWDMLRRYARNMADHRQNVAIISPLELAEFKPRTDGELDIDFAHFDRWVQIFKKEGVIGRIEGGHIGGRAQGWESQFVVSVRQVKDGKVQSSRVDPASPEADAFYARFFPALVKHLKEKDWLDRYSQHLADEPIDMNAGGYRLMKALSSKYAPELRIIEACHTKDLTGAIQIWVPQLNFLDDDFAHYHERQAAGDELWFYTCLGPQGEYANRFIELPLIKTRLLHWINFRYGVTGYLHWGYNYWGEHDPFRESAIPWDGGAQTLPAGDAWIVYPGKDGPLDSIRFEAMRDGIVDHELLSMLAERDPAVAKRLAEMFVIDFDKYNIDVVNFRTARRELLKQLSDKGQIAQANIAQADTVFTVAESKRLIAKAVAKMPIVDHALRNGTVIVCKGTTNTYVAEELLGEKIAHGAYVVGHVLPEKGGKKLPKVDPVKEVVIVKGKHRTDLTLDEALKQLTPGDVIIKGGNALNYADKTVGVWTGSPTGGTTGKIMPYIKAGKAHLVIPIGLEKLVAGKVIEIAAKTNESLDSTNEMPRMRTLPGQIVTEIEALKILADVEPFQASAGGIGGAEGAVWMFWRGTRENVERARQIAASIKGETEFIP